MVKQDTFEDSLEDNQNDDADHIDGENRNGTEDITEKFETKGENDEKLKFPLAPMGVLAPGSAHARPSAIFAWHALCSDQFTQAENSPFSLLTPPSKARRGYTKS